MKAQKRTRIFLWNSNELYRQSQHFIATQIWAKCLVLLEPQSGTFITEV